MEYDIMIPIKIGLLSVVVASLTIYFIFLVGYLASKKKKKETVYVALAHIVIMLGGLLLTGFAGSL